MLWRCSPLIGSISSLECNQSGCGVVHFGLYQVHLLDRLEVEEENNEKVQFSDQAAPFVTLVKADKKYANMCSKKSQ